jgi:hypothetical protein
MNGQVRATDHPAMLPDTASQSLTPPEKAELYRTALEMLNRSGVPYMVGGTYAFHYYAGIARATKDFDIFVRPRDRQRVLEVLMRVGFKTEVAFSHWLAKAFIGDRFIDVIFNSGNGVAEVDDEWFAHGSMARTWRICSATAAVCSTGIVLCSASVPTGEYYSLT